MKKIAFYSKNLKIGGMEKALVNLLNSLVDKYEIYLFLEEKNGSLLNQIDSKVLIFEYKMSNSKLIFLRKIINFSKRILFYLKYHNKFYFSCSYATYSVICSKLALISSKNNSIYIHSNYAQMYKNDIEKFKNFFESISINCFKKLLFVSNESMNETIKLLPNLKEKSYVVNNLVDGNNILRLSKEKCNIFNNKYYNLLFVGRLDNTSKNFDLLLNTFKELLKLKKNVFLTILGSGLDKDLVENKINNLNISNYVKIVNSDINPYKYIMSSNGLILTSLYEGFPVIYLESLILNKAVFTTIPTSDGFYDIKKIFTILTFDAKKNAKIINDNCDKKVNYNFDYKKYNEFMLNKFIDVVEG
ncbi:MAG: glycosyltransferase [Bacilli bacterium]